MASVSVSWTTNGLGVGTSPRGSVIGLSSVPPRSESVGTFGTINSPCWTETFHTDMTKITQMERISFTRGSSFAVATLIVLSMVGQVSAGTPIFVGTKSSQRLSMDQIDHASWDKLLKSYVDRNGMVDYKRWKANQPRHSKTRSISRLAVQSWHFGFGIA